MLLTLSVVSLVWSPLGRSLAGSLVLLARHLARSVLSVARSSRSLGRSLGRSLRQSSRSSRSLARLARSSRSLGRLAQSVWLGRSLRRSSRSLRRLARSVVSLPRSLARSVLSLARSLVPSAVSLPTFPSYDLAPTSEGVSLRLALDAREVPLQFFWVVAQPVLLGLVAQPVLLGLVAQPVLLGLVAQPVTRDGRPCSPIISVGLTARVGMPHFSVRASLPSPSSAPPRKGRGA